MVPAAEKIGEYHSDIKGVYDVLKELTGYDHLSHSFITIRFPEENIGRQLQKEVGHWHHDGGKFLPYAIVVWSNRESTEIIDIRIENPPIIRFSPGDIVLIRNRFAKHRMPQKMSPDRCFARVYDISIKKLKSNLKKETTTNATGNNRSSRSWE